MFQSKQLFIFAAIAYIFWLPTLTQSLPFDDFSSEDERINEISDEVGRKAVAQVDRLFSSAEMPRARAPEQSPGEANRSSQLLPTTESGKHAASMFTSMYSFVSSLLHFGKAIIKPSKN